MRNENEAINLLSELRSEVGNLDISLREKRELEVHVNNIQQLLIESSGPVMPKTFHIWLSDIGGDKSMALMRLTMLFTDNFNFYESGVEEDFCDWLTSSGNLRNGERYRTCVEAIIDGYEVEN